MSAIQEQTHNVLKNPSQLEGRIPNLRINSKFFETSPLEHFYVVVKHILESAWVTLQVAFEAQLKIPDFTENLTKSNNELLRVVPGQVGIGI